MRKDLRAIGAKMICGKNTHMKACINELMTKPEKNDKNYAKRNERYEDRPHL